MVMIHCKSDAHDPYIFARRHGERGLSLGSHGKPRKMDTVLKIGQELLRCDLTRRFMLRIRRGHHLSGLGMWACFTMLCRGVDLLLHRSRCHK